MGQQLTTEITQATPFNFTIDRFAAHYILTQDEVDIEQFTRQKFCKNIKSIVTEMLVNHMNECDAQRIVERINPGEKDTEQERHLENCENIANFYVTIANLYAIVKKASDTPGITTCPIHSLQNMKDIINVQMQNINLAKDIYFLEEIDNTRELKTLYFDVYDPSSQLYTHMSDTANSQFQQDIRDFYTGFAGHELPSDIIEYNDISLEKCNISSSSENEQLFETYGRSLADIITCSKKIHNDTVSILEQIIIKIDGVDTINPNLNLLQVNEFVKNTREKIIEESIENLDKYKKGLEIFETVVEHLVNRTMQNQLYELNKQLHFLFTQ